MARKVPRTDPSILTAAIRKAAEEHDRAKKSLDEKVEVAKKALRDSDPDVETENESATEK